MGRYSYQLYRSDQETVQERADYIYDDLKKLSTFHLREICKKERITLNQKDLQERERILQTIMRFRGRDAVLLIEDSEKEAFKSIENIINKSIIQEEFGGEIQFPNALTLYEGMGMGYFDGYFVAGNETLKEGNVLLIGEDNRLVTILNLQKENGNRHYLSKSRKIPLIAEIRGPYSLLYMGKKASEAVYCVNKKHNAVFPANLVMIRIPLVDVRIQKPRSVQTPLVIDFGTANTSTGMFLDEKFQVVRYLDPESDVWDAYPMVPSVVGILGEQKDSASCVYGYEALLLLDKEYMEGTPAVFLNMKDWLYDIDREEGLTTENGIKMTTSRRKLLKNYMQYLIQEAEEQFRISITRIQMITPVRKKKQFQDLFMDLMREYQVEFEFDKCAAVAFYALTQLMENNKLEKNHWYHALLLDVGTTACDMSSCSFQIVTDRIGYDVSLHVTYENGNGDFGGDHLTYGIYEWLKAKLNGNIPTRYAEYESRSPRDYIRVRNNFLYLYRTAEKIKRSLSSDDACYHIILTNNKEERGCNYLYFDPFRISVLEGTDWKPLSMEEIEMTRYEVEHRMRSSIYSIAEQFLRTPFEKGELSRYSIISLIGQSCNSPLFAEAVKEYIPGCLIRKNTEKLGDYRLKMDALSGALLYEKEKKFGRMKVQYTYEVSTLPYEISALTHRQKEKLLVDAMGKKEEAGFISRFVGGESLSLYLKDAEHKLLKTYQHSCLEEEHEPSTYYDLQERCHGRIRQEETDNMSNGEKKYFVWAEVSEWGFYVLSVLRKENELLCGREAVFYSFEDPTWKQNFFDGKR